MVVVALVVVLVLGLVVLVLVVFGFFFPLFFLPRMSQISDKIFIWARRLLFCCSSGLCFHSLFISMFCIYFSNF